MNGGIRSNMQWKRVGSCAAALALMMTVGVQPALAAATPYRLSVPSGYVSSFSDVQAGDRCRSDGCGAREQPGDD